LKAEFVRKKLGIWFMKGQAFVDDKLVASAELKLAIIPASA
jgi:3-hydroxymyristoyl/3-hydroxydecanoyl-(acyl carrier protein) dehydratase